MIGLFDRRIIFSTPMSIRMLVRRYNEHPNSKDINMYLVNYLNGVLKDIPYKVYGDPTEGPSPELKREIYTLVTYLRNLGIFTEATGFDILCIEREFGQMVVDHLLFHGLDVNNSIVIENFTEDKITVLIHDKRSEEWR